MGSTLSADGAALHQGALEGDVKSVSRIVRGSRDRPALLEERDSEGKTALLVAASSRRADFGTLRRDKLISLLINFGADVHARDKRRGWTALHWACSIGAIDTIKLLLERGCDPYSRDINGCVPQQVLMSPVSGFRMARTSSSEDVQQEDSNSEDDRTNGSGSVAQSKSMRLVKSGSRNRKTIGVRRMSVGPDMRVPLPRDLLEQAWPFFTQRSHLDNWISKEQIEVVKLDETLVSCNVYFNSKVSGGNSRGHAGVDLFQSSASEMDFVQLAYVVNESPRTLSPVLGCYKRIRIAQIRDVPTGVRASLLFNTIEEVPARHSFRFLFVRGELSSRPESIVAASDVFSTNSSYSVTVLEHQSFYIPEEPNATEHEDEEEEGGEEEEEEPRSEGHTNQRGHDKHDHQWQEKQEQECDDKGVVLSVHSTDDEQSLEQDQDSDEDEEFRPIDHLEEARELNYAFDVGPPWKLTALPEANLSAKREEMLKYEILSLSKTRYIWRSRWTVLIEPPAEDFVLESDNYRYQAQRALEHDPDLVQARLDLVPGKISEETFWRAYFWRIELLKLEVMDTLQLEMMNSSSARKKQTPSDQSDDGDQAQSCEQSIRYLPVVLSSESQMAVLHHHYAEKLDKARAKYAAQQQQSLDDKVEHLGRDHKPRVRFALL